MNNSKLSVVQLSLALLFAFTMFAGLLSAALLLAFEWNWLATPMYTFYTGFGVLLSISALVKITRAFSKYDTSSKEDHTRRMLEMGFNTGMALMTWYMFFNLDYTALTNNAQFVLIWIAMFLGISYLNEWFAKEDAKQVNERSSNV